MTFAKGAREVREGFVYSADHTPTDLRQMVTHLTAEVNLYFSQQDPDNFRDIPVPRLCTFTNNHYKIITCKGRNQVRLPYFSLSALNL